MSLDDTASLWRQLEQAEQQPAHYRDDDEEARLAWLQTRIAALHQLAVAMNRQETQSRSPEWQRLFQHWQLLDADMQQVGAACEQVRAELVQLTQRSRGAGHYRDTDISRG